MLVAIEQVLDGELGLVIVVDKKTPEIEEVSDSISEMKKIENRLLEFNTFEAKNGTHIHPCDTLSKTVSKQENKEVQDWNTRFDQASPEVQSLLKQLDLHITDKFRCVGKPLHGWYGFYLDEPTERKKLFAVLLAGKKTATLRFRIDPKTFKEKISEIRPIKGFFFPLRTERAITINGSNMGLIKKLLGHSYKTTKHRHQSKLRVTSK